MARNIGADTEAMTMVVTADRVVVPNLDEYRGQWVAIKGSDVIAAADDPAEVLRQVEERGVTGWVLDRVPENPDTIFVL
jgi:hypothetical protein